MAAVDSRLQDRAFVLNSGAFKDMVARIRHRLLRRLLRLHFMVLSLCFCDDTICLMARTLLRVHGCWCKTPSGEWEFFTIACAMSGNLRRPCTFSSDLLQVFFYLHTAQTRCLQILLRITLDLRLPRACRVRSRSRGLAAASQARIGIPSSHTVETGTSCALATRASAHCLAQSR